MREIQYHLFRDLDRRCVAGGLNDGECREAVRLKRASIESERLRANPLVQEVLAGKTTFTAIYDSYSKAFRGLRRFVPQRHDHEWNVRLRLFGEIVPNVRHFTRRSMLAVDNPVACTVYAWIAALGIALVWAHANRDDDRGASMADSLFSESTAYIIVCFGIAGFLIGAFSMMKYRTRDSRSIHAREAAAYMDINYGYYRLGDDAAWAQFVHLQEGAVRARPHEDDT